MRRVLLVLIALAAAVLAAQGLRVWLASQTTRIRWRLEEMEQGFNETHLGACLHGVAEDWRDGASGLGRSELSDLLRSLFFSEVDAQTKRFLHRVEIERDTLSISLDEARDGRARVELEARFSTWARGAWSTTWRVRVTAEFSRDEQRGWQAVRSETETLESDGRLVREP